MRQIKALIERGWLVELSTRSPDPTTSIYHIAARHNDWGTVSVGGENFNKVAKIVFSEAKELEKGWLNNE